MSISMGRELPMQTESTAAPAETEKKAEEVSSCGGAPLHSRGARPEKGLVDPFCGWGARVLGGLGKYSTPGYQAGKEELSDDEGGSVA